LGSAVALDSASRLFSSGLAVPRQHRLTITWTTVFPPGSVSSLVRRKLNGMLYRSYTAASPLSGFIDDVWLYDDYYPTHLKERILPSGTIELVINLRGNELRIYDRVRAGFCERFSGAIVSGTYDRFFVIDTAEEASLLGVHFRPGGAFPFFGLPVNELVDTHVDLETLWGRSARELRDRLRAAPTPFAKFRVIETALLARLPDQMTHHGAVRFALDTFHGSTPTNLRALCERIGVSQRRFIEVFKAEVGLTPKLFHRVQRFQQLLALVRDTTSPDWSRLAVDCGFFDQSHLIRDFVDFSGFTPAAFSRHQQTLEQRGIHLKRHHLPIT
jgi:AraC-like DNA-binding protein